VFSISELALVSDLSTFGGWPIAMWPAIVFGLDHRRAILVTQVFFSDWHACLAVPSRQERVTPLLESASLFMESQRQRLVAAPAEAKPGNRSCLTHNNYQCRVWACGYACRADASFGTWQAVAAGFLCGRCRPWPMLERSV